MLFGPAPHGRLGLPGNIRGLLQVYAFALIERDKNLTDSGLRESQFWQLGPERGRHLNGPASARGHERSKLARGFVDAVYAKLLTVETAWEWLQREEHLFGASARGRARD